jgi:DNA replication protein DnaC
MELGRLPDPMTPTTSASERDRLCGDCGVHPRLTITALGRSLELRTCETCGEAESARLEAESDTSRRDNLAAFNRDVGRRYREAAFESSPAPTEIVSAVRDAALNHVFAKDWNLVIFGTVGTGKTGLAVSAGRYLIEEKQCRVRFFATSEWLDLVRAAFDEPNDSEAIAKSAMILILDDLGKERATEFALEKLSTLIAFRHRERRPTIITSNFAPAELIERLAGPHGKVGQPIISRLMENAMAIRIEGSDLRVAKEQRAA